jgi:hypothetical protein
VESRIDGNARKVVWLIASVARPRGLNFFKRSQITVFAALSERVSERCDDQPLYKFLNKNSDPIH